MTEEERNGPLKRIIEERERRESLRQLTKQEEQDESFERLVKEVEGRIEHYILTILLSMIAAIIVTTIATIK